MCVIYYFWEWQTGVKRNPTLLTPAPGHLWGWLVASKLNALSSEELPTAMAGHILMSGQWQGRGGPISSHVCRVSLPTVEECPGSAPILLRLSLSPSSPAPSSPPSPLSPVLFACLVLTLFCLIARQISLRPHVFPGFVPPGLLLILQFSLCYMQAHSIFRHCMGAESVWVTDIICTCIVDICSLIKLQHNKCYLFNIIGTRKCLLSVLYAISWMMH